MVQPGLGYTNEQIAAACGSSAHTVRNQLSRAYAKLGVASRAEAVSVLTSALSRGWYGRTMEAGGAAR